jgi:hypothetical protein
VTRIHGVKPLRFSPRRILFPDDERLRIAERATAGALAAQVAASAAHSSGPGPYALARRGNPIHARTRMTASRWRLNQCGILCSNPSKYRAHRETYAFGSFSITAMVCPSPAESAMAAFKFDRVG